MRSTSFGSLRACRSLRDPIRAAKEKLQIGEALRAAKEKLQIGEALRAAKEKLTA